MFSKGTRKNLAQKESGLAATLLCVNVSWDWEPRQKHLFIIERFIHGSSRFTRDMFKQGQMTTTAHLLSVCNRCLEQLLEVCIFRLMLVACRTPLGDSLSMEDEDLEDKGSSL